MDLLILIQMRKNVPIMAWDWISLPLSHILCVVAGRPSGCPGQYAGSCSCGCHPVEGLRLPTWPGCTAGPAGSSAVAGWPGSRFTCTLSSRTFGQQQPQCQPHSAAHAVGPGCSCFYVQLQQPPSVHWLYTHTHLTLLHTYLYRLL